MKAKEYGGAELGGAFELGVVARDVGALAEPGVVDLRTELAVGVPGAGEGGMKEGGVGNASRMRGTG